MDYLRRVAASGYTGELMLRHQQELVKLFGALEAVDTSEFYDVLYERLSLRRYARTPPVITATEEDAS